MDSHAVVGGVVVVVVIVACMAGFTLEKREVASATFSTHRLIPLDKI